MTTKSLSKRIQHEAYQIVVWQLICATGIACLILIIGGINSGFSALAGGMAYVLPNFIFVWRVFRYSSTREANLFVTAFFLGEMIKLLLSAGLFLLIVKYLPVSLLSVLIGFIGAIVSFWIVCMRHFSRQKG